MADSDRNVLRAVRELLTPEQRQLYVTNAWFRHNLDSFVAIFPIFIRGLEADAEEWEAKLAEDLAAIREGSS